MDAQVLAGQERAAFLGIAAQGHDGIERCNRDSFQSLRPLLAQVHSNFGHDLDRAGINLGRFQTGAVDFRLLDLSFDLCEAETVSLFKMANLVALNKP